MPNPFPGMDPYLEHPALWESFHNWLAARIADQLRPKLRPRYVTSLQQRLVIEQGDPRMPDVSIASGNPRATLAPTIEVGDVALEVEVEDLEILQWRVDILDTYEGSKLVTSIEILSPTNKRPGPGRKSYLKKQRQLLESPAHLVEIDLLRKGGHVLAVPLSVAKRYDYTYVTCVSRSTRRSRFALYPVRLRDRLPRVAIPLLSPDPDVVLDLQAAVNDAHEAGPFSDQIRYHQPCVPPLSDDDQAWANQLLSQRVA